MDLLGCCARKTDRQVIALRPKQSLPKLPICLKGIFSHLWLAILIMNYWHSGVKSFFKTLSLLFPVSQLHHVATALIIFIPFSISVST